MASCVVTTTGELLCIDHTDAALAAGNPRSLGFLTSHRAPLLLHRAHARGASSPTPNLQSAADTTNIDLGPGVSVWIYNDDIGGRERELHVYGAPKACDAFLAATAGFGAAGLAAATSGSDFEASCGVVLAAASCESSAAERLGSKDGEEEVLDVARTALRLAARSPAASLDGSSRGSTTLAASMPLHDSTQIPANAKYGEAVAVKGGPRRQSDENKIIDCSIHVQVADEDLKVHTDAMLLRVEAAQLREQVAGVRESLRAVLSRTKQEGSPPTLLVAAAAAAASAALAALAAMTEEETGLGEFVDAADAAAATLRVEECWSGSEAKQIDSKSNSSSETEGLACVGGASASGQCTHNMRKSRCGAEFIEASQLVAENARLRERLQSRRHRTVAARAAGSRPGATEEADSCNASKNRSIFVNVVPSLSCRLQMVDPLTHNVPTVTTEGNAELTSDLSFATNKMEAVDVEKASTFAPLSCRESRNDGLSAATVTVVSFAAAAELDLGGGGGGDGDGGGGVGGSDVAEIAVEVEKQGGRASTPSDTDLEGLDGENVALQRH